ncbi:MAG TPA: ester cyclase [Terracidiphilus sp.]|jgi:predicted ester cyclase|nr:ester cyclase [Terracidiphilus sp.]
MKKSLLIPIALVTVGLIGCLTVQAQTLAENKAIILRSEAELWSKGNLAVADQLYSPHFVCHFVGGVEWKGLQGIKGAVSSHRASFPDWHEKVEDILADGDEVAIRITSTGTQRGEFAGLAPTGRKITIEEFHIYRITGSKIVEQWGMPDVAGMMKQLQSPTTNSGEGR